MANFNIAYAITGLHEGFYANNINDRGGETYAGISRKFWPDLALWKIIDSVKKINPAAGYINAQMRQNTAAEQLVREFYRKNYWSVNNLDKVTSQDIANEVYDSGVNCGVDTAARWLQRCINAANKAGTACNNISVDGHIGNVTLSALSKADPKLIYKMMNCLQGNYYIGIVERSESQEVFIPSWFSRVDFIKQ